MSHWSSLCFGLANFNESMDLLQPYEAVITKTGDNLAVVQCLPLAEYKIQRSSKLGLSSGYCTVNVGTKFNMD